MSRSTKHAEITASAFRRNIQKLCGAKTKLYTRPMEVETVLDPRTTSYEYDICSEITDIEFSFLKCFALTRVTRVGTIISLFIFIRCIIHMYIRWTSPTHFILHNYRKPRSFLDRPPLQHVNACTRLTSFVYRIKRRWFFFLPER